MEKSLSSFIAQKISDAKITGPELTKIISETSELGFPLPEIKQVLFKTCDSPAIQQAWSKWNEVNDREEIRLRLQAILGFKTFDNSLVPFVLFFFRASDPVVYQTAAQIAGKWLHVDRDLQKYIAQYAKLKKVDLNEPIQFNGQRARRRLLITLAEHYAVHGPSLDLDGNIFSLSYTLDVDSLIKKLPQSQLDISILMLTLSILYKHGDNKARELSKILLQLPQSDTFSIQSWDRNIIRIWGILLSVFPDGNEAKQDIWKAYLQKSLNFLNDTRTFTDRLRSLYRVDEILRSAVFNFDLSTKFIDSLFPPDSSVDICLFCKIRLIHWLYREKSLENITSKVLLDTRELSNSTVLQFLQRDIQLHNDQDHLNAFLSLSEVISSNTRWRSQSLTERTWSAFFLLDFSVHCQSMPADELNQLITIISAEIDFSVPVDECSKLHIVLSAVLNRLISAEQTAKGNIPDGKLIHKISDEFLLLELLPSETDTGLLPVLADAFENQIRLLLTTDPAFKLDHYLYQISIREPNRKFYRYIKELSRERSYSNTKNEPAYFSEKIQFLYQQSGSNQVLEVPKELSDNRFWTSLQTIRQRLHHAGLSDDLFSLINTFERELDGTGAENITPESTLHDLVNIVQPDNRLWFRSGYPAKSEYNVRTFNQQLLEQQQLIKGHREKLVPNYFERTDELAETVQRLKMEIDRTAALLVPVLSGNESHLIYQLRDRIHFLLNEWVHNIQVISDKWNHLKKELPSEGIKLWEPIFEVAVNQSNSSHSSILLNVLINTYIRPGQVSIQKTWYKRYQVLSWACQSSTLKQLNPETKGYWLSILRKHWKEMLQSAIDEKQEARVLQLVREPALSILRDTDSIRLILNDVKKWCFDRYDFNHATICNREINRGSNPVNVGLKTVREYFGHFTNVWIALVVGVIMMFDFGDPWTELAEIGDVTGVLFTFILGVGGTYLYVFADLRKKVTFVKTDPFNWASQFWRVGLFLAITLLFTVLVVLLFWYMFSSTDQVVHGVNAMWHIMAWTGFALFVGVFFGLIGKQ